MTGMAMLCSAAYRRVDAHLGRALGRLVSIPLSCLTLTALPKQSDARPHLLMTQLMCLDRELETQAMFFA